ncbi:AAEL013495-PA [Aedes aegypti]|uniref:AAEL013495-PA n=1 Tax=Aedes aegypti TaxID=7159 RepID=Q16IZ7_AEDAE|nr:AAEL013495-PA [Aedes aegypti]
MLTRFICFSLHKSANSVSLFNALKLRPLQLCVRPIATSFPPQQGPRTMKEERYRKKDNVPEEYRIIYRAPMEYYLSACNLATTFSFAAVAGITAYGYLHDYHTMSVPFEIDYGSLTVNENDLIIFLGFFFLANVMIRVMVNRYVLRIYRNEDDYIAIFEGRFPFTRRELRFKRGNVVPVPEGGIVPWQDARFKINDKNVLLLESHFRTPSELNNMLKQYMK